MLLPPKDGLVQIDLLIDLRAHSVFSSWRSAAPLDGFFVERIDGGCVVNGRFGGRNYRVEFSEDGAHARYEGEGFALRFLCYDPVGTIEGDAEGDVDLTYFHLMDRLQRARPVVH